MFYWKFIKKRTVRKMLERMYELIEDFLWTMLVGTIMLVEGIMNIIKFPFKFLTKKGEKR